MMTDKETVGNLALQSYAVIRVVLKCHSCGVEYQGRATSKVSAAMYEAMWAGWTIRASRVACPKCRTDS